MQWDQKYEGDISNVNYRLVPELSSMGESSGDELGWSTVFVYQWKTNSNRKNKNPAPKHSNVHGTTWLYWEIGTMVSM